MKFAARTTSYLSCTLFNDKRVASTNQRNQESLVDTLQAGSIAANENRASAPSVPNSTALTVPLRQARCALQPSDDSAQNDLNWARNATVPRHAVRPPDSDTEGTCVTPQRAFRPPCRRAPTVRRVPRATKPPRAAESLPLAETPFLPAASHQVRLHRPALDESLKATKRGESASCNN